MPKRKPKKRKPRAKRKIVEPTQPSDIPFQKVRVEWIDILSDSGWADDKQFNKKHNPEFFYGKEKKKTKDKKKTSHSESTKQNPVFKVSD